MRIHDPRCVAKTFPDYFEALFAVAAGRRRATIPVHHHRRPDRLGQGHAGQRASPRALGYHFLDSGALYRATALAALRRRRRRRRRAGAGARWPRALDLRFDGEPHAARRRTTSPTRSAPRTVGAHGLAGLRLAARCARRCSTLQLAFRRLPGLVADGRDMGTVIFPDAALKVFLTASAAERAERRHKQLISKGISANTRQSSRRPGGARRARHQSQRRRP